VSSPDKPKTKGGAKKLTGFKPVLEDQGRKAYVPKSDEKDDDDTGEGPAHAQAVTKLKPATNREREVADFRTGGIDEKTRVEVFFEPKMKNMQDLNESYRSSGISYSSVNSD
jgi:hypothetical protein